ncbi:MAG TPA: hypothetical protein DCZ01_05730 [Elusimicrobia bacterium]|nr:MAG: hypothetical protein A2X37_11295 [Elusimicrobia bacterium GWA2_66_18]HAZ08020.1 hypothetical protein [Elusimicrobiota bacterium]
MLAKEIMSRKVITVGPEMTIQALARLFTDRRITGAPVVEGGKILGVVSLTDMARRDRGSAPRGRKAHSFYRKASEEEGGEKTSVIPEIPKFNHVIDIMTPAVLSADENAPVKDLAQMLLKQRIHRLLITRKGKLCGIVTSMDLLRALAASRR